MQALQAPEACISDVHQRDCVRAFIVVMDGQMPNWKNSWCFPILFYGSLLKTVWNLIQEECQQIAVQESPASSLCITTVVVVWVVVTLRHTMSFKRDWSTQAAFHHLSPPSSAYMC